VTAGRSAPASPGSLTAGRIRVELSNTSKIFFPEGEITKGELVEYYHGMAGRMLPYLRRRPIAMARFPDGITGQRIFAKNVPGYFPGWITRAEVRKQDGKLHHVICDKPATLVVGDLGARHVLPAARGDDRRRPDRHHLAQGHDRPAQITGLRLPAAEVRNRGQQ
jgi:DNA primase